jgi:hypothetical protein
VANKFAAAREACFERFDQLLSLFQLPADEAQAARLVRHAIEVGDPEAGYSPLPTGALA